MIWSKSCHCSPQSSTQILVLKQHRCFSLCFIYLFLNKFNQWLDHRKWNLMLESTHTTTKCLRVCLKQHGCFKQHRCHCSPQSSTQILVWKQHRCFSLCFIYLFLNKFNQWLDHRKWNLMLELMHTTTKCLRAFAAV